MIMKIPGIFNRKNRILLAELVRTDFKLRYENSVLGYIWSVLNPLLLFGVLYVVFGVFLNVGRGVENFPIYLLTGIVLWRFFTEATKGGLSAIVQRGGLIRKVNFPKYIIVISGTVSALINLVINMFVVFIFMLISGIGLDWGALWIIIYIFEMYVLALGVSFVLSTANVFLRDIGNIWEIVLQAGIYATPIIYPLQIVADRSIMSAQLLILNPIAQIVQDVRYHLVTDETMTITTLHSGKMVLVPFLIVIAILIAGAMYFKRKSGSFAERV